jgi:hypothetical protein
LKKRTKKLLSIARGCRTQLVKVFWFFFSKKKFFFHLSGKAGGVTPRTLAAEADYGV